MEKNLLNPILVDFESALTRAIARSYEPNSIIFREGDWDKYAHLVMYGCLKQRIYNADGKEVVVDVFGQQQLFGISDRPYFVDTVSLYHSGLVSIPLVDLIEVATIQPKVMERVIESFASQYRRTAKLAELRGSGVASGLRGALLLLGEEAGEQIGRVIRVPKLLHSELAAISGLTRESVTREISRLERKGAVVRDEEAIVLLDAAHP